MFSDYVSFHKPARDQRVSFKIQNEEFAEEIVNVIKNLSRVVWSCDDFRSNESYTQLTNFMQGIIDNEINLNPQGSCTPYCNDFKETKNYDCKPNTLCAANSLNQKKSRCDGSIRDCDYFGPKFSYCPNNEVDGNRRIDFVKLGSGKVLGQEVEGCNQFQANPFMMWISTCRYCFCYCDAPGPNSDRHFSLRNVVSNVTDNKVISGIRIIKENGIIHLTAVERTLLPNAALDSLEKTIISNTNFTLNDLNVKSGSDYFTMTYDNRTLNLDTVIGKADQVVTGVRFRVHSGSVHLEVRFHYFDEDTGKLDLTTKSEWKSNTNIDRTSVSAEHADIPTKSNIQSKAIGTDNSNSIKFVATSWSQDMAQTTVPFIDSNLIESPDMMALSGVGLFYKFQPGFGGYVAPKLVLPDHDEDAMRIRGATGVFEE